MPPVRWLKSPAWANPYAIAIEPTAVTSQDSSEMAPTCAMFVGSMMMPEPIMLTATMNVSCMRFIFFCGAAAMAALLNLRGGSLANHVCVELDAAVDLLLVDALHLVVEAREAVERFLEDEEVIEHRLRLRIPALAGNDDADARRIDERKGRGDAVRDLCQRHVVHFVRDQLRVRVLRQDRELGEAAGAEAQFLQL